MTSPMADEDGWMCPKGRRPLHKSPTRPSRERYGNLIHPEKSMEFLYPARPSSASSSLQGISGSNRGVARRPPAAMMARSGELAGGEEMPPVEGRGLVALQRHPPIPTTSVGPVGGVEEAEKESPLRDSDSESVQLISSLWCPFEKCGDTWDACVLEAEREIDEWVAKRNNPRNEKP